MKAPFKRGGFNNAARNKSALSKGLRSGMASRIIGPWDWIIAPALLSMAMTIVLATSFQPFGFYLPEPVSPFILAFTWPLIRPSYIAPFVLGVLGLFLDLFWGGPLGFWTLTLTLVYGVLLTLRTYIIGQDWLIIFGIFLLSELIFFSVGIILVSIDSGAVPRLWGSVEQAFATTLLFPFVLYLLEKYIHSDVRFQ